MAYKLRNLRNYGVSERSKSVHWAGNPMNHSAHSGFTWELSEKRSCPPKNARKLVNEPGPFLPGCVLSIMCFREFRISCLRIVGNNPDALSAMASPHGCRRYVLPLSIIPEFGQVSENSAKPCPWLSTWANKQVCNVLHDDDCWSYIASNSDDFTPESASCSLSKAAAFASFADVLARESSSDNVNPGNPICPDAFTRKFSDVTIAHHIRPMLLEYLAGEFLDLAERDGFKPARALKPKAEPAYAAEQVEDSELCHYSAASVAAGTISISANPILPAEWLIIRNFHSAGIWQRESHFRMAQSLAPHDTAAALISFQRGGAFFTVMPRQ